MNDPVFTKILDSLFLPNVPKGDPCPDCGQYHPQINPIHIGQNGILVLLPMDEIANDEKFIEFLKDMYALQPNLPKEKREFLILMLKKHDTDFLKKLADAEVRHVSILARKELQTRPHAEEHSKN